MTASERAYALIRQFEGLRLASYRDPVGIWTVGYGTTHGAHPDQTITEGQAEALLRQEVERMEPIITAAVKVPITQNQFDALVSFAYNLGVANLTSSTLLKKINLGKMDLAADEFLRWIHAGKDEHGRPRVLEGLVKRREAEMALFEEPVS